MNKKKYGFTLVELVAVVVILVILLVIAVQITNKNLEKSKVNSFLAEANVFSKGALQKQSTDSDEDLIRDDSFHGAVLGKVCYSITENKLQKYVSKTKNKYRGSVEVCYGPDCTYATKIWITDGKHYIDGLTEASNANQIQTSFTSEYPESCGVRAVGGGTGGSLEVADFDYVGEEQVFHVLMDGVYSLEAWGAQGGDYSAVSVGGFGAYSYVDMNLKKGDTLYVNVGGKGSPRCTNEENCDGGYNGGAKASSSYGAGGGATSITGKSGLLRDVNLAYVYIVAGGGGGANSDPNALSNHHAGGYYSQVHLVTNCRDYNTGSYGGFSPTETNYRGSGGGYRGDTCRNIGAGGNGYVFNAKTQNGVMYCYNCPATWHATACCSYTESVAYSTTKTNALNQVSDDPIPTYSKSGNGYARISYLGEIPSP